MSVTEFPRREFLFLGLVSAGACRTIRPRPRHPVADVLCSAPLSSVRLGGYLGRKLELCIRNRIFAQDPERLVEPFRHRQEKSCWQTEFWGKWFTSAAAACEYTNSPEWRDRLQESTRELVATQTPDGYIGNYAPGSRLDGWDVWGRKYTLLGLLAENHLNADWMALEGARRLANGLMRQVGPLATDIVTLGLYRGMAASSVLEPVVQLYRRTGDQRYLAFGEYIVRQWASPRGPQLVGEALAGVPAGKRFPAVPENRWWTWENGEKAYEMMSCYAGLVELHRATGWAPARDAAVLTFKSIRDSEINVAGSGSSMECWYGGKPLQAEVRPRSMETCVGVSWMQLCASLLRLTGDPLYADEIEKTAYNALLGAMTPDGSSFAQYSALEGVRALGENHCGMGLNCCIANGPRGMMLLPAIAVMQGADGPVVNLYSEGDWNLGSGLLLIRTDYPRSGAVEIDVRPREPEAFTLWLRIPAWSEKTEIAVNGASIGEVQAGSWAAVRRTWRRGDRVNVNFDMRARIHRLSDGAGRYAAITRGPVVLAQDARLGMVGGPPLPEGGSVPLHDIAPPAGIEMAFSAGGIALCDYASAGGTWDDRSRYRTWMPL